MSTVTVVVCDGCGASCPYQAPGFNAFIIVNHPDGTKFKQEFSDICRDCGYIMIGAIHGLPRVEPAANVEPVAAEPEVHHAEPSVSAEPRKSVATRKHKFDEALMASRKGERGFLVDHGDGEVWIKEEWPYGQDGPPETDRLTPVTIVGSREFDTLYDAITSFMDEGQGRKMKDLEYACSIALSSGMPELIDNGYVVLTRDLFSTVG